MALVVQNDAGTIDGANAYVTAAEFKAYHGDRGTDVSGYTDAEIEQAVVRATDYLDTRFRFRGEKRRKEQRTAWPRTAPEDDDEFVHTGIPVQVDEACMEYAFVALTADLNPTPARDDTGRDVQSKATEVGPIRESITYIGGAAFSRPTYPKGDRKLVGFIERGGYFERG